MRSPSCSPRKARRRDQRPHRQRVAESIATIRRDVPGADLVAAVADLSTAEGVKTVVETLPATDILVNNLGIFEPKPFDDQRRRLASLFRYQRDERRSSRRAYLPKMRERNWGRIVFISSESGSTFRLR